MKRQWCFITILLVSIFLIICLAGCGSSIPSNEAAQNQDPTETINDGHEDDVNEDNQIPVQTVAVPLYKVRTLVEMHVRTGPGTNYPVTYNLPYGSIVDVYELRNDGTYLWSRIAENEWIADDGTWQERYEDTSPQSSSGSANNSTANDEHGKDTLDAFLKKVQGHWYYPIAGISNNDISGFEYQGIVVFKETECYLWKSREEIIGYNENAPVYNGAYVYIETSNNPRIYCAPSTPIGAIEYALVWVNGDLNISYSDDLGPEPEAEYIRVARKYLKDSGYFDWKSDFEGGYFDEYKYFEHTSFTGLGYHYGWGILTTDLERWDPPSEDCVVVFIIGAYGTGAGYELSCCMRFDGEHYYMSRLFPYKTGFIPEGEEIMIQ